MRSITRVLKVIFVASTLSFIVLQLNVRSSAPQSYSSQFKESTNDVLDGTENTHNAVLPNSREHIVGSGDPNITPSAAIHDSDDPGLIKNEVSAAANRLGPFAAGIHAATDPNDANAVRMAPSGSRFGVGAGGPTLDDIRASIEYNNAHADIQNYNKFGPINNDTVVVIVQVHDRARYLEKLVQSLKVAKGIDKAFVVFSHDFYAPEINQIVQAIDFTMVLQIFYPHSIQIFPNRFPGQHPNDCSPDIGKEKAKDMKCNNWEHPDKYGHYRLARYTQIKHHWWWKMNYVFHGIPQLNSWDSWVLLLEEDHFVSPDFLHVLNLIIKNKNQLCAECGVLSLGVYLKSYAAYGANINRLAVHPWFSSRHNMGLSLNRAAWNKVRQCSQLFCTFDDYNWDWSLMKVNLECFKPRLQVLFTKSPRVFHIGDCGVHHKCRADTSAAKVVAVLDGVANDLYPESVSVTERSRRMLKPPKENGGWGDLRDHKLCLENTRFNGTSIV